MADAGRRFDSVLVWKLDRFGRSLRQLVNALAELEALDLAFISLSDNLDALAEITVNALEGFEVG